MKPNMRIGAVGAIGLAAAFLFPSAALYAAEETGLRESAGVRIPETAEEHLAMAQSYRMKAVNYEQEAETHRQMIEEYKFKVIQPQRPTGPSHKEAQRHCERYMRDAKKLAAEARGLAEYHAAQAESLRGR